MKKVMMTSLYRNVLYLQNLITWWTDFKEVKHLNCHCMTENIKRNYKIRWRIDECLHHHTMNQHVFFTVGGNRRTWRKPMQTWEEGANSTQKGPYREVNQAPSCLLITTQFSLSIEHLQTCCRRHIEPHPIECVSTHSGEVCEIRHQNNVFIAITDF